MLFEEVGLMGNALILLASLAILVIASELISGIVRRFSCSKLWRDKPLKSEAL